MPAGNGDKATPKEVIIRGTTKPWGNLAAGVSVQMFTSGNCGAQGLCTSIATFGPGAVLPYHQHEFSEAITVLEGSAKICVQGRSYVLDRLDCIHVPRGVAHLAGNLSTIKDLRMLSAFGDSQPTRELVYTNFPEISRERENPEPADPEHIQRFAQTEKYELSEGTQFVDLFSGRCGAVGICGGYGEFPPGTSHPCHLHDFGESITIIDGEASCHAAGTEYSLQNFDTAFIPQGRPHRFLNQSRQTMAMIWVYAGDEPARTLVEHGYCSGLLPHDGGRVASLEEQNAPEE